MQPYQEASKEIQRQGEAPLKALKGAASAGLSLAGGGAILNKITPFLNKFIPSDIAIKGLSKINPSLGKFLKGSLGQGHDLDEVMGFIKDKVGIKDQENTEKKQKNLIEEHAPEVHEILKDRIGQGLKPMAVAYQIAKEGKFSKQIADLQKKTGKGFGELVTAIFGGEEPQQKQADQQQSAQPQQMQQTQQQPQQAQTQQQVGQNTQALMQAIQAAQQARQRRQTP